MRQALRHAPRHRAATANLSAFLRITGEPDAAETLLRDSIAVDPDNAGARLNLAAELLHEERAAEALALLDAAPALPSEPGAARHWYLARSLAHLQLHQPAEARANLEALTARGPVPPEIAPLFLWRHVLLAQETGDVAEAVSEARAASRAAAVSASQPLAVT